MTQQTIPTGQLALSLSPLTSIAEPVDRHKEASSWVWLCWATCTLQQLLQKSVCFLLRASAFFQWSLTAKPNVLVYRADNAFTFLYQHHDSFEPGLMCLVTQQRHLPSLMRSLWLWTSLKVSLWVHCMSSTIRRTHKMTGRKVSLKHVWGRSLPVVAYEEV